MPRARYCEPMKLSCSLKKPERAATATNARLFNATAKNRVCPLISGPSTIKTLNEIDVQREIAIAPRRWKTKPARIMFTKYKNKKID